MNLRDLTWGDLLWEMHAVFVDTGRQDEWEALLAELRRANSRRPRMLEVLDRLKIMPERIAPSWVAACAPHPDWISRRGVVRSSGPRLDYCDTVALAPVTGARCEHRADLGIRLKADL